MGNRNTSNTVVRTFRRIHPSRLILSCSIYLICLFLFCYQNLAVLRHMTAPHIQHDDRYGSFVRVYSIACLSIVTSLRPRGRH
jgi:hypothetical protein